MSANHTHHPHAGEAAHGEHPEEHAHHVLPLKVYFGVWGALMFLTAVTIVAAYEPFPALRVPIAVGIATIKATLVALFFMHLLYDEKFNLVLLISSVGVVIIFLGFAIGDPVTRGMVNPISLRPISPEMTTTTLDRNALGLNPPPFHGEGHGQHHDAATTVTMTDIKESDVNRIGPGGLPVVPSPADVGKEAETAHPGATGATQSEKKPAGH